MPHSFVLSFKKNISVIEQEGDRLLIQSPRVRGNIPQYTLNLEQISPGLLAAIRTLAADGATEEELSDLVLQTDGVSELPKFYYYLQQFINLGTICHTVLCDGFPIATRVPIHPSINSSSQRQQETKNIVCRVLLIAAKTKNNWCWNLPCLMPRLS
jgi:hypothetical protein